MTLEKQARSYLNETAEEALDNKRRFLAECGDTVVQAAKTMATALKAGNKILIFGNGGSAADAQHMAAEMVGRMLVERGPLAAIALTTDTSALTAIGNDYSYEEIFSRQVAALARPGDVVLAISTSGKSRNVILGVEAARKAGCKVIGLTGGSGGELLRKVDIALNASSGKNSSRIQEVHIFAIHALVDLVDRFFLQS